MVKAYNTLKGMKHGDASGKMHNAWANTFAILL